MAIVVMTHYSTQFKLEYYFCGVFHALLNEIVKNIPRNASNISCRALSKMAAAVRHLQHNVEIIDSTTCFRCAGFDLIVLRLLS